MRKQVSKLAGNYWLMMALSLLLPALYVLIVGNRTLPFAEGWYTYYAQCMEEGMIPYRDFEFLYPPLYIYLVYGFTRIFGFQIIILRNGD